MEARVCRKGADPRVFLETSGFLLVGQLPSSIGFLVVVVEIDKAAKEVQRNKGNAFIFGNMRWLDIACRVDGLFNKVPRGAGRRMKSWLTRLPYHQSCGRGYLIDCISCVLSAFLVKHNLQRRL